MGFISRKLIPACGNMCVCCPALSPSSRRPIKRYKKLLAEIFPKSPDDGSPNERKIMKLCEYASKNPIRIPKIAEFIEQRCFKELRSKHPNSIVAVTEAYCKLLYVCNDRMAYFAISLLNVLLELLDIKHQDFIHILGCKTLARFLYSQTDCSYAHNIEALVGKVCQLTRQQGEGHNHLRAASLQCISAMIWFMTEYSHIFADFDEIIYATLDNYGGTEVKESEGLHASHHYWVDEVIRHGTGGGNCTNMISGCINTRHQYDIKDSSTLTREESESPEVWAQICVQKLAALAKESTTLRRVLDPMVLYFDTRSHWSPRRGMAVLILSDMTYLVKSFGNEQLILSAIIRHLDHKNIVHNTQIKGYIIQIASCLVRQQRSQAVVVEIAAISDLCRHLRKSILTTLESVGPQELNWNLSLQSSIEDCLLEIAKGVGDVRSLFDIMTVLLENLPVIATAARATLESLVVLAHIINLANVNLRAQLVFPDGLLLHLLKAMVHPDVETRILAHKVFSLVLIRSPSLSYFSKHSSESRTESTKSTSMISSATALLEKLRREKDFLNAENVVHDAHDGMKEREIKDERVNCIRSSPNIWKIISIIDRAATSTCSAEPDVELIILTEDQTAQLLSAFWLQVYQPDNIPSNYEAIAHSFSLMLVYLRLKKTDQKGSHSFFQFCLSLRNSSLEPTGMMSSSCQRSIFTLAMGMLAFTGKVYDIPELTELIKISLSQYTDPFLRLGGDLQLYACQPSEAKGYDSKTDQHEASLCLVELGKIVAETDNFVYNVIVQRLSKITEMNANELAKQLSESYAPVDCTINADVDWKILKALVVSEESFSVDEEPKNSSVIDGDLVSESPATDIFRLIPRIPVLPSVPEVINVGQLIESALQVAGQVAGTSVSTSPLPYGTMASQCEALGMGTRKKLSTWLGHDHDSIQDITDSWTKAEIEGCWLNGESSQVAESKLPLKLPPASPFDNFLKAARCGTFINGLFMSGLSPRFCTTI